VQERKELDDWIAESEKNASLFKRLTHKGIYAEVEKDFDDARLIEAAHKLSERVGFEVRPYVQGERTKAKLRYMKWRKYVAAAAVILVLAVGFRVYKNNQPAGWKEMAQQPLTADMRPWGDKFMVTSGNGSDTVATPRGGMHEMLLPDGSKVWLHADAKISFPTAFTGTERSVYLSGTAYFEIAGNEKKPFIVRLADNRTIEVLGTHFNVRSYAGENMTISLLEGKIKLSRGSESRILDRLEQATIDSSNQLIIGPVADSLGAINWKDGTLSFYKARIGPFVQEISRSYNVSIYCQGHFGWFSYTGGIPLTLSISGLLRELAKPGCDLHAELAGDSILIKSQ